MKLFRKKVPLHIQIILALILGAVFGSFFNINPNLLDVSFKNSRDIHKTQISSWKSISFLITKDGTSQNITKTFYSGDQIPVISYFNSLSENDKKNLTIIIDGNAKISGITNIRKHGTIATQIKPIGTIFINLLSFLAIPLVLASLIVGAASLEDIKKLGRIGSRTFALFMITTAIAIIFGLILTNILEPGKKVTEYSKTRLLGDFSLETSKKLVQDVDVDIVDFIVKIVPRNPIKAMADGEMLQIVFFAVFFGVTLTFIDKKKSAPVVHFLSGVSDTMIKMVDFVMLIAPYGVFALIASTVAEFGYEIISTLFWYMLTVLLGLLIQTVTVYPLIVRIFGRMSPFKFFKGMRTAQAIAFSTSSSAATLPVTMKCVEENLGIPNQIAGFVLPLGATVNMDGTALYQGVAAVFIAQVYGIELTIAQQLTIIFTAVLASIGTAPVPGVGIIMLIMILQSVNIPPEGIALIIGVDRFLDMCRTIPNITGDAAVSVSIHGMETRRKKRELKAVPEEVF